MGRRVLVAYCWSHAFASKVTRLASLTSPNRRNVCIMKVLHQTCGRSELVIFLVLSSICIRRCGESTILFQLWQPDHVASLLADVQHALVPLTLAQLHWPVPAVPPCMSEQEHIHASQRKKSGIPILQLITNTATENITNTAKTCYWRLFTNKVLKGCPYHSFPSWPWQSPWRPWSWQIRIHATC